MLKLQRVAGMCGGYLQCLVVLLVPAAARWLDDTGGVPVRLGDVLSPVVCTQHPATLHLIAETFKRGEFLTLFALLFISIADLKSFRVERIHFMFQYEINSFHSGTTLGQDWTQNSQ